MSPKITGPDLREYVAHQLEHLRHMARVDAANASAESGMLLLAAAYRISSAVLMLRAFETEAIAATLTPAIDRLTREIDAVYSVCESVEVRE